MNTDVLITALATICGVLAGSITTYQVEKQRRKYEVSLSFRNERKAVYAIFMACIVRWENEIAWRWEAKYVDSATDAVIQSSSRRIEELHQATMAPLFELRMVGSTDVVIAAEEVIQYVYFYEAEHEKSSFDRDDLNSQWLLKRDSFIAKAREEVNGPTGSP